MVPLYDMTQSFHLLLFLSLSNDAHRLPRQKLLACFVRLRADVLQPRLDLVELIAHIVEIRLTQQSEPQLFHFRPHAARRKMLLMRQLLSLALELKSLLQPLVHLNQLIHTQSRASDRGTQPRFIAAIRILLHDSFRLVLKCTQLSLCFFRPLLSIRKLLLSRVHIILNHLTLSLRHRKLFLHVFVLHYNRFCRPFPRRPATCTTSARRVNSI
mmetsp:Transcript_7123/g.15223  ORF Transcript_7123/g.15223 Transcript_7123/m.15223 type:complete len:213 (-) Transcript_7123:952-1590(-)